MSRRKIEWLHTSQGIYNNQRQNDGNTPKERLGNHCRMTDKQKESLKNNQ